MDKVTQFLKDVMHEIDALKEHATPQEKLNLSFSSFDCTHPEYCIYGQLAGVCYSERAKDLMDKCCIRVMNIEDGANSIINVPIEGDEFNINGSYEGQTWTEPQKWNEGHYYRSYKYLSALEGYICSARANNKGVISYIKGEINTLTL